MEVSAKTIHDVKETLNEYFKLKLQYETQIMANKKKIMNNSSLSNREKRSEFLKLKPKCINCKRPGGTRFKTTYFKETDKDESYRQYKATCGIIADPCNLDITVQIGKVDLLPNLLNNIQDEIKERKNTVINNKNKLLFGCITTEDALSSFDSLKDDISFYTSFYEIYLETYNAIVDNDDIKTELNSALSDYYIQIDKIKDCIKKMNETSNVQYAHDAVVIQTTILTPLMEKIRGLKYNETTVLRNGDTNTCNLIQTIYSIQKLSYSSFTDKVVSYNVGTEVIFKKKTAPNASESEEEHTLEEEPNLIKKPAARDEPIYTQGPGGDEVTWKKQDYKELWERLPTKLKSALITDKQWLSDFMFSCTTARAKKEPCVMTIPANLKMPPTVLSNGEYDFGVKIYNDVFKQLPKDTQATYLTFSSEKNGVKNYNMFINSMNDLVVKETGFGRGYL